MPRRGRLCAPIRLVKQLGSKFAQEARLDLSNHGLSYVDGVMNVSALIGTIKGAVATIGKLREITKSMEQAELKATIADLANQLADAELQLAGLKNEMLALQTENQALKSKENAEKPKVQWGCYKFTGVDGLYCPACYDTKGKKHLTTRMNSKRRICSVCQTVLGS
jgi:hypothetical protein